MHLCTDVPIRVYVCVEQVLTMILGGSTNAVLHLIAIAHSVGITLTLDDFQAVSDRTPFLADLSPFHPNRVPVCPTYFPHAAIPRAPAPSLGTSIAVRHRRAPRAGQL